MKRISELEEHAKRVCKETAEEIARIKANDSFIPLINTTLASWKAKLRATASHEKKDWKLVIYSFEDRSLLQYGRYPYDPRIFSDNPWLVQDWKQVEGRDGGSIVAAYADTPEALLPGVASLRLLGCFRLPFAVMPSCLEHPSSLEKMYFNPKISVYAYGLATIWHPDDTVSDLPSIAGIDKPDPTNPEHIRTIYSSKWKPAQMPSEFETRLKGLDTERQDLLRQMQYYQIAINLKNDLLYEPSVIVVCRGRSWIISAPFTKFPTLAEVHDNVKSHFSHKQWKFYADDKRTVEITNDADLLKCQTSGNLATPVIPVWVKSASK